MTGESHTNSFSSTITLTHSGQQLTRTPNNKHTEIDFYICTKQHTPYDYTRTTWGLTQSVARTLYCYCLLLLLLLIYFFASECVVSLAQFYFFSCFEAAFFYCLRVACYFIIIIFVIKAKSKTTEPNLSSLY